jgi:hypothetical protein
VWSVLLDLLPFVVTKLPQHTYFRVYVWQLIADSIFQFAVLVELGWAVLLPIRSSLPKHTVLILALLIAGAGALIWPVSTHMLPPDLNPAGVLFVRGQQTVAALRAVIFIALAGFSQLLSIGWRNRELQIATGLGFYSICSLAVSLIHGHQASVTNPFLYHLLDQIGVASYDCSLMYWIFSFAQQEQERQEFTPQMRSFLLTVTGAARGTRVALANSGISSTTRKPGNH